MSDLNTMLREHARTGLQTQLDAAVTAGDTAAATKIADDIAKLAVSTAPKAPAYGDAEIRAELNKLDWFGVDPKKSGRVLALGRDMDPKKFPDAVAFAAALVKAVDEEFKPAGRTQDEPGEGDGEEGEGDGEEGDGEKKPAADKKPRRTDGPSEGDAGVRARNTRSTGPWAKMSDAPADVQKEITRSMNKFLSSNASEDQKKSFRAKALESHYNAAQQKKGK
jgi:hypothetical protein